MPSSQITSLSVRGLPSSATHYQVEEFFRDIEHDNQGLQVSPLVKEYAYGGGHVISQCCTISFASRRNTISRVKRSYDHQTFWAGQAHRIISVDEQFNGMTPLYEHPNGADTDIYFLHGLSGHPFSTFSNKYTKNGVKSLRNWPQDFLGDDLKEEGLKARITTYGYNANVLRRADGAATIDTIARNLLESLRHDRNRCKDKNRPMYFVCHGLGGLVLCQALILALYHDCHSGIVTEKIHSNLFIRNETCVVKGIVFLGTPFQGSFIADLIKPYIKAVEMFNPFPMNTELIRELGTGGRNLRDIVGRFKALQEANEISLWIGCESDPVSGTLLDRLVVSRDSASTPFERLAPVATLRNVSHTGMVRFDSRDQNYKTILNALVERMVQARPPIPSHSMTQPQPEMSHLVWNDRQASSHQDPGFPVHNYIYVKPYNLPQPKSGADEPRPHFRRDQDSLRQLTLKKHTRTGEKDSGDYIRLGMYDTVFIIDDTSSMDLPADPVQAASWVYSVDNGPPPSRWSALEKCMEQIADIAVAHDEDGVDMYFLKSKDLNEKNIGDGQHMLQQLMKVRCRLASKYNAGGTHFAEILSPVLRAHVNRWKEYAKELEDCLDFSTFQTQEPKGLNIIILTDGQAHDANEVREEIVRAAQALDQHEAPDKHLGLQFLQVGDDPEASKWLQQLDDSASVGENGQSIRDIVNTIQWDPELREGALVEEFERWKQKATMGSLADDLDRLKLQGKASRAHARWGSAIGNSADDSAT